MALEAASTRLLQMQAATPPVTVSVDQVQPRNVFRRDVEGFATPYGARAGAGGGSSIPKLGDRVVNLSHRMVRLRFSHCTPRAATTTPHGNDECVCAWLQVPMGLGGTVIALHAETGCVEVVFDTEFVGGKNLGGLCSAGRGRLVEWSTLLNLSAPDGDAPVHRDGAAAAKTAAARAATRARTGAGAGTGAGTGAGVGAGATTAPKRAAKSGGPQLLTPAAFAAAAAAGRAPASAQPRLKPPTRVTGRFGDIKISGRGGGGRRQGRGRGGGAASAAGAPASAASGEEAPVDAAEAAERAAVDGRRRGNQMRGVKIARAAPKSLKEQVEFFFSDTNLSRDAFMRRMVMAHPDGHGSLRLTTACVPRALTVCVLCVPVCACVCLCVCVTSEHRGDREHPCHPVHVQG